MARSATENCRALVAEAAAQGACYFSSNPQERRQLNRMYKRGELVRPLTNLYADATLWSRLNPNEKALMKIRGLAMKHPEWVFCDMSAALVHGLWVSYEDAREIHITNANGRRFEKGITCHRADVNSVVIDGVRVTTLERTVFDCCRHHPVRASLGVADAALRFAGRDAMWLQKSFEQFSRHHKNWKRASYVASLASPLAENGGESLARATMIMLGFQVPQLQVELPDCIDGGVYRVDYLWDLPDGSRVAGELDGRDKYWLPEMTSGRSVIDIFADERLRESRINALRIPVMRFSIADVQSPRRFAHLMNSFGIPRVRKQGAELLAIGSWTVELVVERYLAA